jgi:hypothetical protein
MVALARLHSHHIHVIIFMLMLLYDTICKLVFEDARRGCCNIARLSFVVGSFSAPCDGRPRASTAMQLDTAHAAGHC